MTGGAGFFECTIIVVLLLHMRVRCVILLMRGLMWHITCAWVAQCVQCIWELSVSSCWWGALCGTSPVPEWHNVYSACESHINTVCAVDLYSTCGSHIDTVSAVDLYSTCESHIDSLCRWPVQYMWESYWYSQCRWPGALLTILTACIENERSDRYSKRKLGLPRLIYKEHITLQCCCSHWRPFFMRSKCTNKSRTAFTMSRLIYSATSITLYCTVCSHFPVRGRPQLLLWLLPVEEFQTSSHDPGSVMSVCAREAGWRFMCCVATVSFSTLYPILIRKLYRTLKHHSWLFWKQYDVYSFHL